MSADQTFQSVAGAATAPSTIAQNLISEPREQVTAGTADELRQAGLSGEVVAIARELAGSHH